MLTTPDNNLLDHQKFEILSRFIGAEWSFTVVMKPSSPLNLLKTWAWLFKINDVVTERFVKISNVNNNCIAKASHNFSIKKYQYIWY